MAALRRLANLLIVLLLMAVPARATWSILIIDLATGEIAIGIATCLTGFDLRPNTVVVVPGYGVAAAQSFVGPLSLRELIRAQLLAGTPVAQILQMLAAADPGHQTRQYGIASLTGGTVTFTGTGAGAWAGGLTGQVGSLIYTVQGNVLTGNPVITAAELAIQNTPGTVADKMMAAMQAARSMGGDGRCSCSPSAPTSCGAPPPSFTKSSHIALMIVSRPSDIDLPCTGVLGCGAGQYYLDINIANQQAAAPDPVLQLQQLYNTWKLQQVGRPDHFQSTVTTSGSTLRANGIDTVTGTVVLRDAQGNPLGNTLPVQVALSSRSTVTGITFSPVAPQAGGSYTFTMRGNLDAGQAILDVAAFDQYGRVGISPQPIVQVTDAFGPCGKGGISDGLGGVIDALRVQGSGGGPERTVTVGYGQPFTIALDPPVGAPTTLPVGMFALWAHIGLPPPGTEVPLQLASSLCFTPAPFSAAPTLLLADSFGLGGAVFAPPAPWSLGIPGVPLLLDVTLQGLMFVDPQATVAATNAMLLRVVPLPAPTITSITPPSPAPAANVTVVGTNFLGGLQLTVAGNPTAVTSQTQTQLQFVMPAGVPCNSSLAVVNLGGSSATRPINPTPVILSTPFASGPAAGGAFYVVSGQNLLGTTVKFNGVPMTITSQSASVTVGTTPPGTVGPAQVVVSNVNGCQATTTYTYQ
ncbi:MAG TPA: DUF1028 domain-containing protein [Planctomycetota bacterium]